MSYWKDVYQRIGEVATKHPSASPEDVHKLAIYLQNLEVDKEKERARTQLQFEEFLEKK